MNIKTLSFTILSILMLTACGGGNSSSSNSNTPAGSNNDETGNASPPPIENKPDESNNTQTSIFASYSDNLNDGSKFAKVTITLIGDTAYSDRSNFPLYRPFLATHYLTKEHHYDISDKKTDYGYEIGKVQRLNNLWIFKPYSSKNYNHLTITDTVKKIDLSGKLLAQYIDAEHYSTKRTGYMALFKDAKFSKGAECLMVESTTATEEYVTTPFYHLNAYASVKDYYGDSSTQEKTFAGYKVHLRADPLISEDIDALVEADGKFFSGDYYPAGKNFDWYELNPELGDECELYNEQAQKDIDAIVLQP